MNAATFRLAGDTIVARATPAGVGAVAIVRCSGPLAPGAFEHCFEALSKSAVASHRMTLGRWRDPNSGEAIDMVLAVRMDAPHSFTGEDVVEAHCHGGMAVVEAIVDSFVACGARPAQPGEFTRRAFLNGKMDLAQAEAIADVVQASTARARRLAQRQLEGDLSRRIEDLRGRLVNVIAELEAYLDFPEEDLPRQDERRLRQEIAALRKACERLVEQGRHGRLFREGARVVIAGPPNAGKSSLFNALLRCERAIVSPHPGTTRDTIESTIDLDGLAVTLVDTAGLREEGAEEIERMGVERTAIEMRGADVVLWLMDLTETGAAPPPAGADESDETLWLRVGAKLDAFDRSEEMARGAPTKDETHDCRVSSVTSDGIESLEELLSRHLLSAGGAAGGEEDVLVSNRRHIALFSAAAESLATALHTMDAGESSEFAIIDLRAALSALDNVLGREPDDAILDAIFSRFCIGK